MNIKGLIIFLQFFVSLIIADTLYAQEFNYFPIYKYMDKLNLSKDQRDKLADLRIDYEKQKIKYQSEMEIEYLDLERLYEDVEKNLSKIEDRFNKIASLRIKTKMARLRYQIDRKKVLTKRQIEKIKELIGDRKRIIRMRLGGNFGENRFYFNNKFSDGSEKLKQELESIRVYNSPVNFNLKRLKETESKVLKELKKINLREFPRFKVRISEEEQDS